MAVAPNFTNRTMWTRDNLDVLRGLNDDCIDLVYAAPPFNNNKNYEAPIGSKAAGAAFRDTWTLSDIDLAWHGEIADREPTVYAAIGRNAVCVLPPGGECLRANQGAAASSLHHSLPRWHRVVQCSRWSRPRSRNRSLRRHRASRSRWFHLRSARLR